MRRIEWNVTARTGVPHVRVELAERVLVTWLVLDLSASMAFGTGDRRKADVAEGVARRGRPRGDAPRQPARRWSPSAARRSVEPPAAGPPRPAARARARCARCRRAAAAALRDALDLTDRVATQRALVVVVSDFRGPLTGARRCCGSPAGTPCWRSRCATRASRSSPTSASCGSSIRRPAGSCASTPAIGACASDSPSAASEERRALAASLATAGVGHVALSTEGDWLRPLAAFLRRGRRTR